MNEVYNFSAGPAVLPKSVLQKAASELIDYRGTGMSVMEMSHRSKVYEEIIESTESTLRELMKIPANYKVLFLQGGASTQFAMVPLNLMTNYQKAHYINTGMWSKKAISEAKKYGEVSIIASSEDKNFSYIPDLRNLNFSTEADYVHITTNNTIFGTKYTTLPDTKDIPLVADMSSNILSETMDVTKFGLIYAGAQKNMGPAGVTVVIIREDLIREEVIASTPTMLKYCIHAKDKSLYNTPPTYGIYIAGLVFEYFKELGGIEAIEAFNYEKAKILYDYLDNSQVFKGTANKEDRSIMNVPFVGITEEINKRFIKAATENGLLNLKGHRSVGGMRASIYNAMPKEGVLKLISFMEAFEKTV